MFPASADPGVRDGQGAQRAGHRGQRVPEAGGQRRLQAELVHVQQIWAAERCERKEHVNSTH